MSVDVLGRTTAYQILSVQHFDSARKRMSSMLICRHQHIHLMVLTIVVLKDESGGIIMLCKGADSAIYERLIESANTVIYMC